MNDSEYYEVKESLGFLTITTNRLMSGYFRKQLVESGLDLTAEQWGVLAQLWNKGSIAQDELAHNVCVDKSSLSRVLDVMERRGLVVRKRDPDDARRKILYPTQASDRFKDACRQVADQSMAQLLRDVTPEDHAVCLKVLSQVKETIRELTENT